MNKLKLCPSCGHERNFRVCRDWFHLEEKVTVIREATEEAVRLLDEAEDLSQNDEREAYVRLALVVVKIGKALASLRKARGE